MEIFLLIALGLSFVFIAGQALLLYKMSKIIKGDEPPF